MAPRPTAGAAGGGPAWAPAPGGVGATAPPLVLAEIIELLCVEDTFFFLCFLPATWL